MDVSGVVDASIHVLIHKCIIYIYYINIIFDRRTTRPCPESLLTSVLHLICIRLIILPSAYTARVSNMVSEKPGHIGHGSAVESPVVHKFSSDEEIVLSHDTSSLPPGYFTSTYFLGTMVASGLAIAGVR